jgi:hypothetical protein
MENVHIWASNIGAIIGILAHIPLFIDIKKGEPGYSFTSFALWSILDFIAARNLFLEGGDYTLSLTWGICAGSMALLLLFKKQVSWSWIETMVVILIAIILTLWYFFGSRIALFSTIASLIIASFPQIKDANITRNNKVGRVYIIFSTSAVVSIFSAESIWGGSFNIIELIYPLTAFSICMLVCVLSFQKQKNRITSR